MEAETGPDAPGVPFDHPFDRPIAASLAHLHATFSSLRLFRVFALLACSLPACGLRRRLTL